MITLFGNNDRSRRFSTASKKSVSGTRWEIASRVEGMFAGDRRLDPEQLRRLEKPCSPPTWAYAQPKR